MVRYQKFAENFQRLFGECSQLISKCQGEKRDQINDVCEATKRLLSSFQKCDQLANRLKHVGFEYPDECPESSVAFQCSIEWNELKQSFLSQQQTSLESSLKLSRRSLLLFNIQEILTPETEGHSLNSLTAEIAFEIEVILLPVMAWQASNDLPQRKLKSVPMIIPTLRCNFPHECVCRDRFVCRQGQHLRDLLACDARCAATPKQVFRPKRCRTSRPRCKMRDCLVSTCN